MRKGWRPSAVIFFKTGPNAFLLIAVAGLKSGKKQQCDIVLCALHRIRLPSTFQDIWSVMPSQYTEDESARPIGAPPSIIHAMRPINLNVTAPQGRNPLGKISSEKNSCLWTLHPFWKSHQSNIVPPAPVLHICHLLGEVAPADPLNP